MKSYKLIIKSVEQLPCRKYHIVYNLQDYFEDDSNPQLMEMVRLISDWTDESPDKIMTATPQSVTKACEAILEQLNSYKANKPREEVKGLTFRMDYDKMSAGWWNHVNNLNMKDNPMELLGLVYIEKGMGYAEVDKHSNVINPVIERQKILENELFLSDFLDVAAFFLNAYVILKELSLELYQNLLTEKPKNLLRTVGKIR